MLLLVALFLLLVLVLVLFLILVLVFPQYFPTMNLRRLPLLARSLDQ
jgi:hypothetical protein